MAWWMSVRMDVMTRACSGVMSGSPSADDAVALDVEVLADDEQVDAARLSTARLRVDEQERLVLATGIRLRPAELAGAEDAVLEQHLHGPLVVLAELRRLVRALREEVQVRLLEQRQHGE